MHGSGQSGDMLTEVQPEDGHTFTVRINGGLEQVLVTRTGIYRQVAAAAVAMLPYEDKDGPIVVEVKDQWGEGFTYRIGSSQDGSLVVETHNLNKDKILIDLAREQGVTNAVPSVLVEYRQVVGR